MSHTDDPSVTSSAAQPAASTSELVEIVTNPARSAEFVTDEQRRAYEDARDPWWTPGFTPSCTPRRSAFCSRRQGGALG